ncbi:MAG TPA: ATP-binding protein [Ktedonobacteraceae bacterium]|nr:ATP-binding protein [Ktedonobacteraceae bacterium]
MSKQPLDPPNSEEQEDRFDRALLVQPAAIRLDYFEKQCTFEHTFLERACNAVLREICMPGEEVGLKRLGTTVLVIGPSRVGKSTLIRMLEKRLLARAQAYMLENPGHLPYVSIEAAGPRSGRFDWIDYYVALMRGTGDPFIDRMKGRWQGRDLQAAALEAIIQRCPFAIIVDEAHQLAKASAESSLQDQLDHLKYFENHTGVSHVLVGTYDMRPFRKANAQLAGRSVDVHFPRYNATEKEEREIFKSVLWSFQLQMPVEEEPLLLQNHWEFLYARSIGCIGLLKLHLNRALSMALAENARTVTEAHLQATAATEDRVKLWLKTAINGENDLIEEKGANERLLVLLGLKENSPQVSNRVSGSEGDQTTAPKTGQNPGKRNPNRDPIGLQTDVEESAGGGSKRAAG